MATPTKATIKTVSAILDENQRTSNDGAHFWSPPQRAAIRYLVKLGRVKIVRTDRAHNRSLGFVLTEIYASWI